MKYIILTLSFLYVQTAIAQEIQLNDNWEEVKKMAKKENKNILIILTGSEWCAPCKKMDKKLFTSSEFQKYADENLVLFVIDLPRNMDIQSETYINYTKFEKRYDAKTLPALVLTDHTGKKIKNLKGRMFSVKNVMKQLSK